jgi:predicted dithiol-disulfide oxidoreductase (DUF899 family)
LARCSFLNSLAGGELKGMTKMLASGRQDATDGLMQEAEAIGAAVLDRAPRGRGENFDGWPRKRDEYAPAVGH